MPTFHGASTDVMAVASQAISLGAIAVGRGLDVGYVFATAHSPYSVPQLVAAHVEADVAEQYP